MQEGNAAIAAVLFIVWRGVLVLIVVVLCRVCQYLE